MGQGTEGVASSATYSASAVPLFYFIVIARSPSLPLPPPLLLLVHPVGTMQRIRGINSFNNRVVEKFHQSLSKMAPRHRRRSLEAQKHRNRSFRKIEFSIVCFPSARSREPSRKLRRCRRGFFFNLSIRSKDRLFIDDCWYRVSSRA